MTYHSRWEKLPVDVLYQQILFLEGPSDILTFCYDPYIESKICQDKNGLIWQLLYKRDISKNLTLKTGENLMDKYIDIYKKCETTKSKDQLLKFSIENGYEILIKLISLSGISLTLLSNILKLSIQKGNIEIIKYLINFSISEKDGQHFRSLKEKSLKWAAYNGNLEIVKYLIEKGSDLHFYNEDALQWAALRGQLEIVKYLIEIGLIFIFLMKEFYHVLHVKDVQK